MTYDYSQDKRSPEDGYKVLEEKMQEAPNGEVFMRLSELSRTIDTLRGEILQLKDKIHPVLESESLSEMTDTPKESGECELSSLIIENKEDVVRLINLVIDLKQRTKL